MQLERFRTETTRAVVRHRPFQPDDDVASRVADAFAAKRSSLTRPALAVAVVDADGVRVHVTEGSWPTMVTVGRHTACDLFMRQADASLRHTVVFADADGVTMVDLGSSFGVTGTRQAKLGVCAAVRAADSVIVAIAVVAGEAFDEAAIAAGIDAVCDVNRQAPLRMRVIHPEDLVALPRVPQAPHQAHVPRTQRLLSVVQERLRGGGGDAKAAGRSDAWRAPRLPLIDGGVLRLDGMAQPVMIGRYPRNDVVVEDTGVSRVHAVIIPMRFGGEKRAVIVDVGSTNGTEVITARGPARRGRICEIALGPVGRGHVIADGDMVVLSGGMKFRVVGDVEGALCDRQLSLWERQ
jgi:hypothetical protein